MAPEEPESISFDDRQYAPRKLGGIATSVIGAKATEIDHRLTENFLDGAVVVASALEHIVGYADASSSTRSTAAIRSCDASWPGGWFWRR